MLPVKAIVLGGTRGIGRAIASSLEAAGCEVVRAGRQTVDTSDMDSVRHFADANPSADILVLNTGGPPPKTFVEVTDEEWLKYHNQLFMGFVVLLREITINRGGYVFLVSSSVVKEPSPRLVISSAYRAAFVEVFKICSREQAARDVSFVNIAPGLISTDRTKEILGDMEVDPAALPMGRMGEPREIGDFVSSIVERRIKYLSGVTITFDGASSAHVF